MLFKIRMDNKPKYKPNERFIWVFLVSEQMCVSEKLVCQTVHLYTCMSVCDVYR